ncbi:MAG: hypothetical protein C4520_06600 [Candidatus Abyssobacteria bacterium SURF_5]|uniref:Cohesin domain-containing protein n=1 Tax=Abyssobacteria bacterium (strain SURF_5) TaxID=2093360 RepID=A0A3A4NRX9_ABYX5|nr:MAG: hypothetical protein C4520_06600 [Candidatus Abyssubacteria bacterium SURF_5]
MRYQSFLSLCLLILIIFAQYTGALAQECAISLDSRQAQSSSSVTLCVTIDQAPNVVDAFGLDVIYDTGILTYTGNWLEGDLGAGFQFLDVNELVPGQIRIGGFTTEYPIGQQSAGTISCLEFVVGECGSTTLTLSNLVDDISGWPKCDGQLSCLSHELTNIHLQFPVNQALLSQPPTFTWSADGGTSNVFAVDIGGSPGLPKYWSTYEDLHQIINNSAWTIPAPIWNSIPSGTELFWRVRGVDLDAAPPDIIISDEIWSFSKQ